MRRMRILLISAIGVIVSASFIAPVVARDTKRAASGETQIVARLEGREITISDLRSEQARLGLSPNDPNAERIALESIVNRALLTTAAREIKIHRQPEALRRMAVAREQALADLYIATASQPPEPTLTEIENFVAENPSLFGKRRIYTFMVLTIASEAFDAESLTPLFDESDDFTALAAELDRRQVEYSVVPLAQPSNAFPEAVRKQLAQYGVNDNIVIKSDIETQIMKIDAIALAPVEASEALTTARRILLQRATQQRAEDILAGLKKKSSLSYFRASAAPLPADAKNEAQ